MSRLEALPQRRHAQFRKTLRQHFHFAGCDKHTMVASCTPCFGKVLRGSRSEVEPPTERDAASEARCNDHRGCGER
eukprot:2708184-Rhodomonas_salina.1